MVLKLNNDNCKLIQKALNLIQELDDHGDIPPAPAETLKDILLELHRLLLQKDNEPK